MQPIAPVPVNGRALTTLIHSDPSIGHVTLFYCGQIWRSVSEPKRTEVFALLSSFNGTSFTIRNVRRNRGCFDFVSDELLIVRTRLLEVLGCNMQNGHDKAINEFHTTIVDSEESRKMFTEGNSFQFTFATQLPLVSKQQS